MAGRRTRIASLTASGLKLPPGILLAQAERRSVVFHVKVEERVGSTLTVSLFDPATGEEYRQRYQFGEAGMFAVVFELAGGGEGHELQYTAELDGFRLASGTLAPEAGEITLDADDLATKADIPAGKTIDDLNLIDRVRRNIFKDYRF